MTPRTSTTPISQGADTVNTTDLTKLTGFVSGERHRSTDELFDRAARAATAFARAGVEAGDRVAIMLRNDLPFIEASYGAQLLGAIPVPLNWHFIGEEAAFILRDSDAKALVVHADLLPQIEGAVPDGVTAFVVATPPEVVAAYGIAAAGVSDALVDWEDALASSEPRIEPPPPAPPSMIYTSGTTGQPKAVRRSKPIDPENPLVQAGFAAIGCAAQMRTVICGPMYHSAPNFYALWAGRTGGLVILQPRFDAEQLLALIERYAINRLHLVPVMMIRLLRLDEATRRRHDLTTLELAVHAAAPCPPEVKRAMIEWWGPIVSEYYGGTESGACVSCTSEEWLAHPGTVGKPLPGCAVRILDLDGNDLPAGERGDVYLRNEAWGEFTYHGHDEARREIERDGFVTVGDIGYVDEEGFLHLSDRRKDMIISGGVNIYPAEIEAVLHTHPGVKECAVFGIPDAEFGEAVAAVIEPTDPDLDAAAVSAFLREQLAGYKVPRLIEFATDLPREDSGKIFKRKLRAEYWPEGQAI
jgi:long-chain acyl-CoA synthetase